MIVIESYGIGIGKTTLGLSLKELIAGAMFFPEKINQESLALMYGDIEKGIKPSPECYSFQFEAMSYRLEDHILAQKYEWYHKRETIHDRSIFGDHAFAHNLMVNGYLSKRMYKSYVRHRKAMENLIMKPQTIIRLEASPETCIKRLKERMKKDTGRECEVAVTVEYLEGLRESYNAVVWPYFQECDCDIFEFDWENPVDTKDVLKAIDM